MRFTDSINNSGNFAILELDVLSGELLGGKINGYTSVGDYPACS